jgi:hypothetical protein
MEFALAAQRDVFTDDAIRADLTTGADDCLGMNDRRRMH